MKIIPRHPELAFADRATQHRVQQAHLDAHLAHCRRHSPFYRRLWAGDTIGLEPLPLEGLSRLPLTAKADLEACNDAFLALPMEAIADIVVSSGTTTGRPTRILYSARDLERLAYNEEKALGGCGLGRQDRVLLTCTLDRLFIAGLAYFLGLQRLGAATLRNGLGSLESHAEIIRRLEPSAIIGVPSFLRKLGHFLRDRGIDPGGTRVSRLICIGEPLRDRTLALSATGRELQTLWRAQVFSTYASSETVTSFCECEAGRGGHLHPDLAVVEIVDDAGRPLASGQCGEVVVTPLLAEGMPLVRFRTGDISFLMEEPCPCGRLAPRLGPILGRRHQMLKVCGTTLYPPAIHAALEELEGVLEHYLIVERDGDRGDRLTAVVAPADASLAPETVSRHLQARLRVTPRVVIAGEAAVRREVFRPESRKPLRFLDRRSVS